MSLPQYSKYKSSGAKWLGEVPFSWDVRRAKYLFEIKKRIAGVDGFDILSITQQGIKIKDIESNDGQISMDYSKYQVVEVGDFAMNHMDLLTGYVDIAQTLGVTSPDYRVFSIRKKEICDAKYFLSLFQNGYRQKIFYAFGQGASQLGRWRLPTDQFNDFVFPLPPLEEQKKIVAFLDRETAKIDSLISEQEKLISLLAEKRQATISHAVTKGLAANPLMKYSGVEWLGDVPDTWEVWKLSHVFSNIGSGTTPKSDDRKYYDKGNIPWLNTGDLNDGVLYDCSKRINEIAIKEYTSLKLYPPNSIVIAMYGATIGKLAIIKFTTTVNQACCVFGETEKIEPRFLFYWFWGVRKQIISLATGGGQPNISQETLRSLRIGVPNFAEQLSIVSFLDDELRKIDKLLSATNRGIELLQERRGALISAAVTGKIDVRQAVQREQITIQEAA